VRWLEWPAASFFLIKLDVFWTGGRMAALKVGDIAPDFELPGVLGERRQSFRMSDYRGKKNVVLVFYVLDWSPV
jgi:peroxiredoxin